MKVVLDTNTLVSATIAKGNEFELLRKARNNEFELILSLGILDEFEDVISRKRFGYGKESINRAVDAIIGIAEIVEPTEKIDVIKEDPDDNKILECALCGKVDYIVSGDHHLFDLEEYRGIKIVRTRKMLEILEKD